MRLYSFVIGNYLSGGQHGIQTGHAAVDIARQDNAVAHDWADNHKTFIILNAHNFAGVSDVATKLEDLIYMYNLLLRDATKHLPSTRFHEDEASLNGMLTCFACVLPESIYAQAPLLNRLEAAETLLSYYTDLTQHETQVHSVSTYANLISCTLKAYNLAQL